jgi:trans-aconitate methyltransferase
LWAFGFYRQADSVLEIGTGPLGGFLPFVKAKRRVGVDPCYGLYQESGVLRLYPGVQYITEHFESWATNETFDLIFSSDSLDHGEMGFNLIPRIAEKLNPGGRFYLHVNLRTSDRLNQVHDHCLTVEDLDRALAHTGLIELRRDFYESDIDGSFAVNTLVGVWEKP